jgi:hypothetical protein
MPNPFDPMQLTPRDMFRAAPVLKEQAGLADVDPYDLLDVSGDRYLRRVLIIWCLRSRDDPAFTWDQAWDTPFGDMFDEDEDEDEETEPGEGAEPPLTQTPASDGNGPSRKNGTSRRKRPAAEPALNSSTSTP